MHPGGVKTRRSRPGGGYRPLSEVAGEVLQEDRRGHRRRLGAQHAGTELGVSRFVPWEAARSVVRLEPARAAERSRRWGRIAAEAARQCGRSDVPEVAVPGPLAAALAAPAGFVGLAFHAGAGAPLASLVRPGAPGYLALLGPEGGLTDSEMEACLRAGLAAASLGPRVLRAETAAVAAAALLQHLAGDLG